MKAKKSVKAQNQKIFCNKCKHEFLLNSVVIKEAKVEINNRQLLLVYFTCPKCNEIYRVSLLDARYYELKEDLEKTKKRIRKNHGSNNEDMARMLNQMVNKKLQRLSHHVDKLNEMFSGTFTFVTSGNNQEENNIKYLP